MELGFWKDLEKPYIVLAPMADVTDSAFRRIIAKYSRMGAPGGGPSVIWNEFVSVDGLASEGGRDRLMRDLAYSEGERPIVAQLFGARPENFTLVARMVADLGYDGIDINMGCPDRTVNKQGAGAALCKNPPLAQEIIRATQAGAPHLPISVKIRIGWTRNEIETWLPALLEADPAVITIHARTRQELSKVPPHWDAVARAVEIRNASGKETRIIANGGIMNHDDSRHVVALTGCDGVMMGKAVFGNPWLFDESKKTVTVRERLMVMLEHTELFLELIGDIKKFSVMKKHYKAYVHGFPSAKELRIELMDAPDYATIQARVQQFLEESPHADDIIIL
ncbi:MAG: tRNA-dihydrouridine synthase [Candidatus Pacebacteria bacterium]|nr:tRNA-dihydrouridine synthase [Candidatus Paceibacterota bacterium]MCD8508343.1 tRNA-dihydrouridine synthase [Candidatus Paceibacterota bacterium]MCD8528112.1 tRNA-dihydrouridine synthase [Candidatus Paceibacterota bacterium]MCD8563616.1 tRNA-dihydrouridine synthase [Candidatus Paceibacterota bacterium]